MDKLGLLLTHHLAITDAASAYRLYDRPAADRLKVILTADWSRS
ncbi:hypothetical protein [Amycolatopsis sp. NPDC098790]